jgi:hypothetical protein
VLEVMGCEKTGAIGGCERLWRDSGAVNKWEGKKVLRGVSETARSQLEHSSPRDQPPPPVGTSPFAGGGSHTKDLDESCISILPAIFQLILPLRRGRWPKAGWG